MGVVEDGSGNVWVALNNGGLWRYSGGEWSKTQTDSLNAISLAPDGSLWLGTYYNGALRFDGEDFTRYDVGDGLVHANVNHVYVDASGVVWFATSGGVSRYVP
jgi:streptogramin lyase